MMRQIIGSLLALVATMALLSGCKKSTSADYNLDIKETLRLNLSAEPPSLDWHVSSDTTSNEVTVNIMDGLIGYDLNDPQLKLVPKLATKWETKDQKTWVFTLRDDVKWTDGVPFTAQHVVDGFERLLNPKTPAKYSYMLFNVKNAKRYSLGDADPNDPSKKTYIDFSEVGIKINDKGQVVIELEQPQNYFPMLLTHHSLYPIRKDIVEKFGDRWTRPENIQTLGAYKLNVWDNDKAIVLERNPNYYGTPAKTKFLLMRIVKETSTALKMFEKGQLDSMNELPSLEIKRLKQLPEYVNSDILGTYYLGFNIKKAPMDNPLLRQAISMAIDREEIVKMLDGGQKPIYGWLPTNIPGFNDKVGLRFDPEKARSLLEKAGFSDRTKLPKLVIGFNTNENNQRLVENVQAQLKRNLGLSFEIQNTEWKSYNHLLQVDAPMIFRMGWIADYPDPDTFFTLITTDSENNHTNWGNPKFDSLVKRATSVATMSERKRLYDEAQKILNEIDVPVVPIYSYTRQYLVSKRVKNYPINALMRYEYKDVELNDIELTDSK